MRRVLIAAMLAVPSAACTTSDDLEWVTTTSSTPPAAEAESGSPASPPDSDPAGLVAPGAVVESDPRWLMVPEEPTTEHLESDCRSLADQAWDATCERLAIELGDAVWIREHRGQRERVSVYVHRQADAWELAWRAAEIVVHMVLRDGRSGPPVAAVRPGEGLEVKDCPFDCVPKSERRQRMVSYTPEGMAHVATAARQHWGGGEERR